MLSRLFGATVATATLMARTVAAEGTADLEAMLSEHVVTTASATAQRSATAPGISVTFTAEDLHRFGLRTLAEAIDFLSLGVVTADPLRTPDIGARGVLLPADDGKHFLVLVNGHALNDPLYGAARFDQGVGVPLDVVDRVEVVIGPGSVLYGSNAMLGVVNIITKSGADYKGGHTFAEYEFGRSVRVGAGLGSTFRLFGERSELTASAEYYNRFGPDLEFDRRQYPISPTTGQVPTFRRSEPGGGVWGGTLRDAYFTEAPSGALRFRSGNFEANVLASIYRRGIPYTASGVYVDFDDRESYEMDRAVRVDLKYESPLSSIAYLTSRLYGDGFDYRRQANLHSSVCIRSDVVTCEIFDVGRAHWMGLEERLSLNWFQNDRFVTLLGVDTRIRRVGAKQDTLDFDTKRPFGPTLGRFIESSGLVSPYLQQTWSPTSWLDINAGARLDVVAGAGLDKDERFSPILSPRGAVAWSPFARTTFRAIYSEAFRAPTWSETDGVGYQRAPSRTLEPEKVRSVEGSIEQGFSTHRILFGVFRTRWDSLIESRALTTQEVIDAQLRGEIPLISQGVVRFGNVTSIENYGWNGGISGSFNEGKLSYAVNATAALSRRQTAGTSEPLAASPQLFGNARIAYALGGWLPTPAVAIQYVGARAADRAYTTQYDEVPYAPGYVRLRATLSGSIPAVRGLGYRLSAAYTTASNSAYVAGLSPVQALQPLGPSIAVLAPVDRFSVFLGLRYDFGGSDEQVSQ